MGRNSFEARTASAKPGTLPNILLLTVLSLQADLERVLALLQRCQARCTLCHYTLTAMHADVRISLDTGCSMGTRRAALKMKSSRTCDTRPRAWWPWQPAPPTTMPPSSTSPLALTFRYPSPALSSLLLLSLLLTYDLLIYCSVS